MRKPEKYLVVGGDSLVGGSLVDALRARGHRVLASTRRRDRLGPGRAYLDFEDRSSFQVSPEITYAFVVAAATNYERCAQDPQARQINVVLIPELIESLLQQGLFVTFISTNSVFGGERPWPQEDDPHAPGIPYAQQKAEAEVRITAAASAQKATDRLSIVRLTKILGGETSPLPNWVAAWRAGKSVEPFSDLVFSPISVRFVGEALAAIGEKRVPGCLHLSGSENVSYVDFASALALQCGFRADQISSTTSEKKGVHIPFKPRYSGLGMNRTTQCIGVQPQTLRSVVEDLAVALALPPNPTL